MRGINPRYKFYHNPKGVENLRLALTEVFRSFDVPFRLHYLTKEDNFQIPITRVISYQIRDSVEEKFTMKKFL